MIGIYKIENLINGKIYIGQSINIERRWSYHRSSCVYNDISKQCYNYPLYRSFRKYGIENFDFSIIELCEKEQLDEKEKCWINFYKSYINGYNLTLGGQGTRKELPKIYQYDLEGNFLREFKDINEVEECLNIKAINIYRVLSGRDKTAFNYRWSYDKVERLDENNVSFCPVIAFTLEGKRVKKFNTIKQACKETGDSWNSIKKSCDTKIYGSKNYQWRYWKEDPDLQEIPSCQWKLKKAIDQYDLKGNFIATYESIRDAAKKLNLDSGNITSCCKHKQKSCGNFLWCYHNEEIILKGKREVFKNKKSILQFTKENEFIAEYKTATEAAKAIGDSKYSGHISECCQGKRKTCQGFIWKYKKD